MSHTQSLNRHLCRYPEEKKTRRGRRPVCEGQSCRRTTLRPLKEEVYPWPHHHGLSKRAYLEVHANGSGADCGWKVAVTTTTSASCVRPRGAKLCQCVQLHLNVDARIVSPLPGLYEWRCVRTRRTSWEEHPRCSANTLQTGGTRTAVSPGQSTFLQPYIYIQTLHVKEKQRRWKSARLVSPKTNLTYLHVACSMFTCSIFLFSEKNSAQDGFPRRWFARLWKHYSVADVLQA